MLRVEMMICHFPVALSARINGDWAKKRPVARQDRGHAQLRAWWVRIELADARRASALRLRRPWEFAVAPRTRITVRNDRQFGDRKRADPNLAKHETIKLLRLPSMTGGYKFVAVDI